MSDGTWDIAVLGVQAADAVRGLNHLTRHPDIFPDPAALCWLLADLASMAGGLPQLLDQIATWLTREHAEGRLRIDTFAGTRDLITATKNDLADASRLARALNVALGAAHQRVAHLSRP